MMDSMSNAGMGGKPNVCNCPHHKVVPGVIVLVGLFFVLQSFGMLLSISPMLVFGLLLLVVGFMKLMGRKCKCCSSMH